MLAPVNRPTTNKSSDDRIHNENQENSIGTTSESLPLFESIIEGIAKVLYYVYNFDAMAIYKGNYRHRNRAKYASLYLRQPELRINELEWNSSDRLERLRPMVRRVSLVIYFVILVRFSMICVVQFAKYQATTFIVSNSQQQTISSRVDLNTTTTTQTVLTEETNWIKLMKVLRVYHLFGDQWLSDFPGVVMFVYISVLASISYSIYYLPRCHQIEPADACDLRMGLEPERERRRLDLMIGEDIQRQVRAKQLHERTLATGEDQFFPISKTTCRRRKKKTHEADSSWSWWDIRAEARPSHYWSGHRRYWLVCKNAFVPVVGLSMAFAIGVQISLINWSMTLRCSRLRLISGTDSCCLWDAFTPGEIYTMLELIFAMYWMGIILGVSQLSIVAHLDGQLTTIGELERDMNDLLTALRLTNELAQRNSGGSSSIASSLADTSRKTSKNLRTSEELNKVLLRSLVRTNVHLSEVRSRAEFISEQVSSLVVLFGMGMVLALTAVRMEGPDIEHLRANIIRSLWLASNFILIICAHEFARLLRLERVAWPIAAQLNTIVARQYNNSSGGKLIFIRASSLQLDPLLAGWLRLIECGCLVDIRNSVRPFGVSLTFKRILQMNFYVTSLAALVIR